MDVTAAAPAKRPRISKQTQDRVGLLRPGEPLERAVGDVIKEAHEARISIAEVILHLEDPPPENMAARRWDLAHEMDITALVRVLKLRLLDRGITV